MHVLLLIRKSVVHEKRPQRWDPIREANGLSEFELVTFCLVENPLNQLHHWVQR